MWKSHSRILRKWIAGLQGVRAAEVETAAVNLVAARLSLCCHYAAYRFTEFGVIILQGDFGFRHRIQVGIDHDDAEDRILIVGAIEFESSAAEVLALRHDLLALLRIFCSRVAPSHQL